MSKRIWIAVAILVVLIPWIPADAQEPSNPYIYYYSDALNAFIIERADGTDARVLGDGLMPFPDNTFDNLVAGPGWSPSGDWFAWTAAPISGYGGAGAKRPYVLSVDGTQRLTLLDNIEDAYITWANDRDVLFVATAQSTRIPRINLAYWLLQAGYPPLTVARYVVIDWYRELTLRESPMETVFVIQTQLMALDVANGTVLSSFTHRSFSDYRAAVPSVIQTYDGAHVIMFYRDECAYFDYDCGATHRVTMDALGTISDVELATNSRFSATSSAGWTAYLSEFEEDQLRIENVFTEEQYILDPISWPDQFIWDPSGQYALVANEHLWLLNCETAQLTLLQENWETWATSSRAEGVVWSPDSRFALLPRADQALMVLNRSSGTLTELPIEVHTDYYSPEWYWLNATQVAFHFRDQIIIYDLESLTAQYIDIEIGDNTDPRLSRDGQRIAFVDDGPVLYDLTTATYQKFRPSYISYQTGSGGEVQWDASGEWVLVSEEALVAGGAFVRDLEILRADGTQQRDLSFVWLPDPDVTLNWLPSRVDPNELPPPGDIAPILQPVTTLHDSHRSFYVDWSPDGRWLATGLVRHESDDISVWDMATGEIVYIFKDAGEDKWVAWPQAKEFVPELYIPEPDLIAGYDHVLARSPDGQQIFDGMRVIDLDTGQVLAELDAGNGFYVLAAYSPGGNLLATTSYDSPVRIWDTTTWQVVAALPNRGQAVAFSPDGTLLAVAASWDVQIWDVADLLPQQQANGVNQ